jgi:hypothetical protein
MLFSDFYLVLQDRKEDSGAILAEALRVIVVAIDGGVATYLGMESHPSLQILQQIWPSSTCLDCISDVRPPPMVSQCGPFEQVYEKFSFVVLSLVRLVGLRFS